MAAPPDGAVMDLATVLPLVVLGAGRAALAVVSRLPPQVRDACVVIDPTGEWLGSWARRMHGMGVQHLRTPVTLVPNRESLTLQYYAQKHDMKDHMLYSTPKFVPVPTLQLFAEGCADYIGSQMQGVKILDIAVESLEPMSESDKERLDMPEGGMRIRLEGGGGLFARQVVNCAHATFPNVPAFVGRIPLASAPQRPPPPGKLRFAREIDVRNEYLDSQTVLIVGGGTTSCTLALAALRRGAEKVILVSRRNLKKQEFECDVKFYGNKGLYDFYKTSEPRERLKHCRDARARATISRLLWKNVQDDGLRSGRLKILQDTVITTAAWDGGQWRVRTTAMDREHAAAVAAAAAAAAAPAPAPPPATPAHGGLDDLDEVDEDDEATAPAPAQPPPPPRPPPPPQGYCADQIWVACGEAPDVASDPMLANLMRMCPVRAVGGYPVLDDACRWPGLPLYCVGPYTTLAVGPGAHLMYGHRAAAERVVKAMQQHAQLAWKGEQPYDLPAGALDVDALYDDFDHELEEEDVVAEPDAPTAPKAPPPQPKADKREVVCDVSDLPADLPRLNIEQFSWTDENFQVEVMFTVPEPVTRNMVRCVIQPKALEVWCVCEKAAYRFYIPSLYKPVLHEKSTYKVSQRHRRVTILLHKYDTYGWRFLRA